MTGENMVSIVTAAHNAESTITETLGSVRAQTYSDWELVVVSDGSTDGTRDIIQNYAEAETRIRLENVTRVGKSPARNLGIGAARNKWLLFLDADDLLAPIQIELMIDAVAPNPSLNAVHCGWARMALDGMLSVYDHPSYEGDLFEVLAKRSPFPIHACLVERTLVEKVGGFDPTMITCEEWDLWQRIARTGAKFGAVSEVLAIYRMRPASASLDALQMLQDGFTVLHQGHSADPRVPHVHPAHAKGSPFNELAQQRLYYACWCAGLLIGKQRDT